MFTRNSFFKLISFAISVNFSLLAQTLKDTTTISTSTPKDSVMVAAAIPEKPKAGVSKFEFGNGRDLEVVQFLQIWDIYTIENAGSGIDKRNDTHIRRGRFGVRGNVRKNFGYVVTFAYDGIGKDKNSASGGAPNPEDFHDIFPLDVYLMWRKSNLFNFTVGFFRPQIGKEAIASSSFMLSQDKAFTNSEPRLHMLGRGIGRESGVNIGGILLKKFWSINYNFGVFDPSHEKIVGKGGSEFSPLLVGRIALSLGDPEMQRYGISYTQSYYGKRKGITLGVNSSYQSKTEIFCNNSVAGADILANYGPIDFTVEYDYLIRNSYNKNELTNISIIKTSDEVWSIKVGYNFQLNNGHIIQPTATYSGVKAQDSQKLRCKNVYTGAVTQDFIDVGINWLINQDRTKVNLHYITGNRRDKENDTRFAFVGLGLQLMF